jgi:hypothetical protein
MSHDTNALVGEIRRLWRALVRMMSDPYRPERHYMRGNGPKSRGCSDLGTSDLQPVLLNVSTQVAEVERLLRMRSRYGLSLAHVLSHHPSTFPGHALAHAQLLTHDRGPGDHRLQLPEGDVARQIFHTAVGRDHQALG